MDIEEARRKYVGKLIMLAYSRSCHTSDIGICTAVEVDDYNPERFYIRFTRRNGDRDRYYFHHTPTSRTQWHVHAYDGDCPVREVPF